MNNYIFPEELDNFSVDGAEAIITATADGNRVQFTQEGDENGEVWISGLGDLFQDLAERNNDWIEPLADATKSWAFASGYKIIADNIILCNQR